MEDSSSISLVDNTVSRQPTGEGLQPRTSTLTQERSLTKHLSRASVHDQRAKRKYAKWQPDRLGIAPDTNDSLSREPSQVRGGSVSTSSAGEGSRSRDIETVDVAPSRVSTHNTSGSGQANGAGDLTNNRDDTKSHSEMDILYENQRGWFFFGVPRYSHSSLLNFDPSAWMTQDRRPSPVNITNAQLPDPSWEWTWKTWYVDMSGDTDEQGWQYSFSFTSSSWHGTQPWFHSFVRRRRWVRLRTKALERRDIDRSDFEKSHMLTPDYFTIHSSKMRSREQIAGLARVGSGLLNHASMTVDEESHVDEIWDIPSLMHALKLASIDRERIDALKRFIEDGGEELYYLNDKMPDIMPMFLFQTSRWQFATYLSGVISELSKTSTDSDKDADAVQRKKDNLARAAESCKLHISGPDVFKDDHGDSGTKLLDLTPVTKHDTLMAKRPVLNQRARPTRWVFRGIPKAAEIGQPSSGHRLPVRRPAIFGAKRSIEKHLKHSNAPNSYLLSIHVSGAIRASSLMLLRGCPCLRRRLSAVLDTVATGPDEPLLFLYPRWAAPALQRRRISSLRPIDSPARLGHTSGSPFCAAVRPSPSLSRHSRQWISSESSSRSPDGSNSRSSPTVVGERPEVGKGKETGFDGLNESGGGRLSAGQKQSVDSFTDTEHATSRRPLRGFALTRAKRIQKSRLHNKPLNAKPSPLTQKQLFLRNTSIRDRKKLRFREYMKKKYQSRSTKLFDNAWFETKDILDQVHRDIRKNPKKSSNKKEILVPEETLALFSGVTRYTLKENIWYIPLHNGCRVHILPASQNKGLLRRVVLSATDHIMALVEGHFTRAQSLQAMGDPLVDIHKPPVPMCISRGAMQRLKLPVPLIRGNWHFGETSDSSSNLDEILLPRPVIATVKEFTEHVEDVTSARQPTLDEKAMSLSKLPHVVRIKLHLEALFMEETYSNYISTAALNNALEFLCRHEFLQTARALCSCTEHVATTDTYNILLRAAARRQDVGVFRHFLRTMPRLHMRPNPETWLALLSALVVPSEKAHLIEHMVQRGHMSNLSTIHSALQETIQDSLLAHLDSGQDVGSFIGLMTNTWGANWFSPSVVGQMFSVAARLKDFKSIDELMEICIDNNLTVDSYPLSHIVQALGANVHVALQYTLRFFEHPLFEVTPQNWEDLFLAAFRSRQYNICLVIWRYSCMKKSVTYKMKQAVLTSLCRNASFGKPTKLNKDLWSSDAGKVIIGIDLHHENYRLPDSILDELPSEFRQNPILYLIGWKPRGEQRDLQIRLANALIKRDLILGATRYAPQHPSPIMLDAASILDKEWRGVPRPLTWKMQNAIQVPIVRKDKDRDDRDQDKHKNQ
ncbi:uncharacterized protein N7479_007740 [Penicillium vulpinum]|uniref:Peroxin/Ferlin domain-containing protein n=1 Tax=Penicillium vulpinum TaxID=29845 RepID=A0A1V6SAC4_9EURO|nr:uncharacterized protein N7479_007740 [Penicillium vulpinum]KAJ5960590.1 hypothetical protein N7479_007740 [Penicillium vulpinum]OQE11005.1 hypothetical protein PENVUL_c003G07638 [Penicillium vulpinum]